MTYYAPWLVTRDYVRLHRGLETAETDDDTLLDGMIADASADFIEGLQRIPMPYVDTKSFGADAVSGLDLKLRDDLLAVTSITDADGAAVSASLYNLRPDNRYPKHTVELKSTGGDYWNVTYREDRIQVAGTWGYVPHYINGAWKSQTTLAAAITTTTATSCAFTSATGIEVGHYARLTSGEVVFISALSGTTATIVRAQLGTTATTHLILAAVEIYQQLADLRDAVREMVAYAYKAKDKIGGTTRIYEGGTLVVEDISPRVEATRLRHLRKLLPMGV